jgi:hypothetical protein
MKNWKTIFAMERLTATPGDPFVQGFKLLVPLSNG